MYKQNNTPLPCKEIEAVSLIGQALKLMLRPLPSGAVFPGAVVFGWLVKGCLSPPVDVQHGSPPNLPCHPRHLWSFVRAAVPGCAVVLWLLDSVRCLLYHVRMSGKLVEGSLALWAKASACSYRHLWTGSM